MTYTRLALSAALLVSFGCTTATTPPKRGSIVPLVDHHQHIVGPTAVSPGPAGLVAATLPAELDRVLQERNRIAGKPELGELYTAEPAIIDITEEGQPWVRGREAVQRVVGAYRPGARFVPNAFAIDGSVAWIAGVIKSAERDETRLNFFLGLKKDDAGAWRIASEQAMLLQPRQFSQPITGDQLVKWLDIAGIERAVVLSVAYWFGSPNSTRAGDEYTNVRAENDWVAAEGKKHPTRLIPFCGVSPIRDYAVQEVRRCASELGMKGLKMHFRSSRVDVMNPEHLEKVKQVFRAANEARLPIVVHSRPSGAYGRAHAEVFVKELLPLAPDIVVQIAHLWGGNEFNAEALGVFADAVAAGDSRTKNLYFDLTEVEVVAGHSDEAMQEIARRIRQIGLDRILYGSDATTERGTPGDLQPVLRWARLRTRLPLTDAEMQTIANNVAPYAR